MVPITSFLPGNPGALLHPGLAASPFPSLSWLWPWLWSWECRTWSHGWSNGTQHCTVPPSGWRALVSVPPSHPPQGLKLVLAVGFKLLFPSSSASGHLAPDAQSLGPIGALAATGTTVFDAEVAGPPGPLHALAPWAFHLYFVFLFGHL